MLLNVDTDVWCHWLLLFLMLWIHTTNMYINVSQVFWQDNCISNGLVLVTTDNAGFYCRAFEIKLCNKSDVADCTEYMLFTQRT